MAEQNNSRRQKNSRRLRLVITIFKGEREERELEGDEHKEEIIYDHGDYPSSKSNDSNDEGIRREFPRLSQVVHDKNKDVDDEHGEKVDVSNFRINSIMVSTKNGVSRCDVVGKNDAIKERSEVSGAVGSLDVDDLESILRQRALENLRKFRGGMQTNANIPANQKDKNNANVNILSNERPESVQLKSISEDDLRVVSVNQSSQQLRLLATRKDSFGLPTDRKISEGNSGDKESLAAEHVGAIARDQVAPACTSKEKVSDNDNIAINSASISPKGLRQESPKTYLTLKQGSASRALVITGSEGNKTAVEFAQSVKSKGDNNNGDKTKNVYDFRTSDDPSSSPGSMLADVSLVKQQDGTKEGSQFEEKTMSVMRGGELVQVSYKVYIPKKPPALARRQLKR